VEAVAVSAAAVDSADAKSMKYQLQAITSIMLSVREGLQACRL